ncbi:MAG: MEKHLA domain-containing protein [Methylococcaceae bacterium]
MNSKGTDKIGAFFISTAQHSTLRPNFCVFHIFMDYPAEINNFLTAHVADIRNSYRQLLTKELISGIQSNEQFAKELFYAPFAVVSHNTAPDPVFNYANLKALELFELNWEDFAHLPSRLSAEPA